MGEIDADVQLEQIALNEKFLDSLSTEFFIATYFGDVTDVTTRTLVTEVIPLPPNPNRNEKARVVHVFSGTISGKSGHLRRSKCEPPLLRFNLKYGQIIQMNMSISKNANFIKKMSMETRRVS